MVDQKKIDSLVSIRSAHHEKKPEKKTDKEKETEDGKQTEDQNSGVPDELQDVDPAESRLGRGLRAKKINTRVAGPMWAK